jgi:hypothetical protein
VFKSNSFEMSQQTKVAVILLVCLCCCYNVVANSEESVDTTCPTIPFDVVPAWVSNGGFLLLILASLCSLWGMAHVCEEYFCPALSIFCLRWQVPDSVAGSLVMAAGKQIVYHVFIWRLLKPCYLFKL